MLSEEKLNFLMNTPESLKGILATRLITCLKDEGFQTVFSALRYSENDLLRIPNLGRKSVAEFKEYAFAHGFKVGDTAEFFENNRGFFMCSKPREVKRTYGSYKTIPEKEVTDRLTKNPDCVNPAFYRQKLEIFLSSFPQPEISLGADYDRDLEWIISLLPDELKKGLSPEFTNAAFASLEFRAKLAVLKSDGQVIALRALEKHGLDLSKS